jgi:hypothetical protein
MILHVLVLMLAAWRHRSQPHVLTSALYSGVYGCPH